MKSEDFRALIEARQSIRYFEKDREIPLTTIEEIIDDAQQAPSDCNRQSWKFIVVTDQAIKEKILKEAGGCKPTVRSSVLIVPIIQMGWNHSKFSLIQTLAAATYTLILSAKTRGLSGVWMAGIGNIEMIRKILNIPPYYVIDCFVALGYAKDGPWPKPPRQEVKNIYSINKFDFNSNLIYPLKTFREYDFWKVRNKRNRYSEWNPKKWTLKQIALFRGNSVWSDSPSSSLHRSRRLVKEFEKEIEITKESLKPGKTLLLLPFSGAYSASLLKKVPDLDLTHFELAPSHKDLINKRLSQEGLRMNIPFYSNDDLLIPLKNELFDNILIFQTLEGMPNPSVLIKEAKRLLKAKGRLIITCRNSWSWFYIMFKLIISHAQVWNFGPMRPISLLRLNNLLADGFKGEIVGISPLPTSNMVGKVIRKWPFKFLSRLLVFIGEKK